MRLSKKIICVLLSILFCFQLMTISFANDTKTTDADINPAKYSVISCCSCSISISGITATMKASLSSKVSASKQITMELQKIKSGVYSTIETYTKTGSETQLIFQESRLINALATYRLKVTFTAGSETVVAYAYP